MVRQFAVTTPGTSMLLLDVGLPVSAVEPSADDRCAEAPFVIVPGAHVLLAFDAFVRLRETFNTVVEFAPTVHVHGPVPLDGEQVPPTVETSVASAFASVTTMPVRAMLFAWVLLIVMLQNAFVNGGVGLSRWLPLAPPGVLLSEGMEEAMQLSPVTENVVPPLPLQTPPSLLLVAER